MFLDLRPKTRGWVTIGGNQRVRIVRVSKIGKLHFPSIDNVLLVEGLKHNILSISQNVTMDLMFLQ